MSEHQFKRGDIVRRYEPGNQERTFMLDSEELVRRHQRYQDELNYKYDIQHRHSN